MNNDGRTHGKVCAITSGKGGVGKTSIAVNLSIILAQEGKKVLLIDADMGLANIDLMTGISPSSTIEDVIAGRASIFDAIAEGPEGITIMPAGSAVGGSREMEPSMMGVFRKELLRLENAFDFVFIDTGAGISANVVDFVFIADEVIVVMTPEPTAVADAYAMVKLVTMEKPDIGIGVIINMVKRIGEADRLYGKFDGIVRRFLGRDVRFRGGVVHDDEVQLAVMRQVPLALSSKGGAARDSLRTVAANLLGKSSQPQDMFNR